MKTLFRIKSKVLFYKLYILEVSFFILLLMAFNIDSIFFKIVFLLTSMFIVLRIFSVKNIEKNNHSNNKRKINLEEKKRIIQVCEEMLKGIERMFEYEGYPIELSENPKLNTLNLLLNSCITISEYKECLNVFTYEFIQLSDFFKQQKINNENYSKTRNANSEKAYYLQILGLNKNVNDFNIIKKAHRDMLKMYHPDKHFDSVESTEKSKEINTAFDYLKKNFCH